MSSSCQPLANLYGPEPPSIPSTHPTLDMFLADFKAINNKLVERIAGKCLAKELRSKGELDMAVNTLTETIQEVLNEEVPLTKPCPYMK